MNYFVSIFFLFFIINNCFSQNYKNDLHRLQLQQLAIAGLTVEIQKRQKTKGNCHEIKYLQGLKRDLEKQIAQERSQLCTVMMVLSGKEIV